MRWGIAPCERLGLLASSSAEQYTPQTVAVLGLLLIRGIRDDAKMRKRRVFRTGCTRQVAVDKLAR
eukprot:11161246-Lingulodinium_polyedra.AAC.1